MIPISQISKGDAFCGCYGVSDIAWVVIDTNTKERLVLVDALIVRTGKKIRTTWLKSTNNIFDESRRIDL
jgi:hypothetical protein